MNSHKENVGSIALIDDDEMAHVIFKALTKIYKSDLAVTTFISPYQAIDQIEKKCFQASIIILDINMPEMNGWDFLKELEKMNIEIPVYILSSSKNAQDRSDAKKFKNVLGYLVKPLTIDDLREIGNKHSL